jgi:hypothetical protein
MGQERVPLGLDQILEPRSRFEFQYQSVQDPSMQRPGETYPLDLRSLLEFLSDQHPGLMSKTQQRLVQLERSARGASAIISRSDMHDLQLSHL